MSDLETIVSGEPPEGGEVYQMIGAAGVVLELRLHPDGSSAFCTFHRDDHTSRCYGMKLSPQTTMQLATMLVGSPPPGVGVN